MIEIINMSKKYKELELFDNVNLSILEGKKILIKGLNGSGKSVLLKLLVGYAKPNKGYIKVDGKIIGKNIDFLPNSGVSINAPEFLNNLSGLDNLLTLASIRGIATKESITNFAKTLGLDTSLNKKYSTYSLGMKQKMRLIQALMDNPEYLILDEPFDALDEKSKTVVVKLLSDYTENDKTLIFTSHDKEDLDFADIVYEIKDKNLVKIK